MSMIGGWYTVYVRCPCCQNAQIECRVRTFSGDPESVEEIVPMECACGDFLWRDERYEEAVIDAALEAPKDDE